MSSACVELANNLPEQLRRLVMPDAPPHGLQAAIATELLGCLDTTSCLTLSATSRGLMADVGRSLTTLHLQRYDAVRRPSHNKDTARKARAAGVVYSLAWGDQPALICEHVDWARACGFHVVCAGKGTRYLPAYHQLTPDTVWDVLVQYLHITDRSLINPKMFNSFLDGTKSGIEMAAVCNATGLVSQPDGLTFPPASRFEQPRASARASAIRLK